MHQALTHRHWTLKTLASDIENDKLSQHIAARWYHKPQEIPGIVGRAAKEERVNARLDFTFWSSLVLACLCGAILQLKQIDWIRHIGFGALCFVFLIFLYLKMVEKKQMARRTQALQFLESMNWLFNACLTDKNGHFVDSPAAHQNLKMNDMRYWGATDVPHFCGFIRQHLLPIAKALPAALPQEQVEKSEIMSALFVTCSRWGV